MSTVGMLGVSCASLLLGIFIGAFLNESFTTQVSSARGLLATVKKQTRQGEDLLEKTKTFLEEATGFWSPFQREWYADDYVFRGQVIGPFNLNDEEQVLSTAGPYMGFPDINPGVHSCWLDVSVDRLVYCVLYPSGKHTKDWHGPTGLIKASNHSIQSSGEVWSVLWDDQGKVKHQTVGHPINVLRGNTCGFGAAFGAMCVAKGSTHSTYRELVAAYISEWTLGIPKQRSKAVPQWWSNYCQGYNCP